MTRHHLHEVTHLKLGSMTLFTLGPITLGKCNIARAFRNFNSFCSQQHTEKALLLLALLIAHLTP